MTTKLDVGKALEKLRGGDESKSRMTILDKKNKALDEEIRRVEARVLQRSSKGRAPPGQIAPKECLKPAETTLQGRDLTLICVPAVC
ncbi:unnamed protein product [marine sediment metagenome]|uniref:Uncharacterized protein n=1 Tax=marine sediment metagenome TaxID=412755 RepID=X1EZ99_9ZZZZ